MGKICGKKHLIAENFRCFIEVDDKGFHPGFCLCHDSENDFADYDLYHIETFCDDVNTIPNEDVQDDDSKDDNDIA